MNAETERPDERRPFTLHLTDHEADLIAYGLRAKVADWYRAEADGKPDELEREISEELADLAERSGDELDNQHLRSKREIKDREEELFTRRWYVRQVMLHGRPPWGGGPLEEALKKYPDLKTGDEMTDFEWGELAGRHAVLRWVLDPEEEWDDPSLGDT